MQGQHVTDEDEHPSVHRGGIGAKERHWHARVQSAHLGAGRCPQRRIGLHGCGVYASECDKRAKFFDIRFEYDSCDLNITRGGAHGRVQVDQREQEHPQLMLTSHIA